MRYHLFHYDDDGAQTSPAGSYIDSAETIGNLPVPDSVKGFFLGDWQIFDSADLRWSDAGEHEEFNQRK